jgi:mono/diheme cytochrome c family protein
MMKSLIATAGLAAVLAVAGCGGADRSEPAPAPAEDAGAQVFASVGCVSCHTLKAAGATGQIGPNLDKLKPSAAVVARQVAEGGGAMPAFKDQLSTTEIREVARYVANVAGR